MPTKLLGEDAREQLVRTSRTAIGEHLRSVTYFTRDDYEQLYLRTDLEQDADLSSFIGHEWHDFKTTQTAYQSSELGDYRFTVRVFENGYLARVTTERDGLFVTTDEVDMRGFKEVATALSAILGDE